MEKHGHNKRVVTGYMYIYIYVYISMYAGPRTSQMGVPKFRALQHGPAWPQLVLVYTKGIPQRAHPKKGGGCPFPLTIQHLRKGW